MRTILTTLHSKYIHNSLALPCLASFCGDECGEILIREFTVHEPRESVLAMLLAEKPDVLAFSVYIWNRRQTLDLVDALAVAKPGLRIILGGPEVSFANDIIFNAHPGVTALIRGEGEEPLKTLLLAWHQGHKPQAPARTALRHNGEINEGEDSPPLPDLDRIPSPLQAGSVDFNRGFVYYETSRGCPFHCSFCLSARDNQLRSYSMSRIRDDLLCLMRHRVKKIKLVDRTFNYDSRRAREIFSFILEHNICSHFHFEIAAHLLDTATLQLLRQVPADTFQFEIGVQSTLESTLDRIDRKVSMGRLEENVRYLKDNTGIHLHLDLVSGLPGDSYADVLKSIDRVIELAPHHLQIEPVKLLPGSPLRQQANQHQIHFDPNPPYTILHSRDFSFDELQQLQEIGRLVDLIYNSGNFKAFLTQLSDIFASWARGFEWLAGAWRKRGLFRFPMSRQELFRNMIGIVRQEMYDDQQKRLVESLAYDYARCERIAIKRIPDFFDTDFTDSEKQWIQTVVQQRISEIKGQGIKLQYFAAVFSNLKDRQQRRVHLFCYLTATGTRMKVEEFYFSPQQAKPSM